MSDNYTDIISRIRQRREELGLSYQDLASLTGMSKSTLQRYETGEIRNLPVSKIPILASALHMSIPELTGWRDASSRSTDLTDAEWSRVQKMRSAPPAILEAIDKLLE